MAVPDDRQLPPEVAHRLGPYYVYLLIDPRDGDVFYVGKGKRDRLLAHGLEADLGRDTGESAKIRRIREIRETGLEPRLDVVRHGLSENGAYLVEAALIDCLPALTNAVSGHRGEVGRLPLTELVSRYGAQPLEVEHPPVLMIRLAPRWRPLREEMEPGHFRDGHGWYPQATADELFDAVRGWWKVSPPNVQRKGVEHVVAVVEGVTRGLYRIEHWFPRKDGRWCFTGSQIDEGVLWLSFVGPWGHRVPFRTASQNPLVSWPPA